MNKQTSFINPTDLIPVIHNREKTIIEIKDLVLLIVKIIEKTNTGDALYIAKQAESMAIQALADVASEMENLTKALAYATKAYELSTKTNNRVKELETNANYLIKVQRFYDELKLLVSKNTRDLLKSELRIDSKDRTYKFYKGDSLIAKIDLPKSYSAGAGIKITDNIISFDSKDLKKIAYTGRYSDLVGTPDITKLNQNITLITKLLSQLTELLEGIQEDFVNYNSMSSIQNINDTIASLLESLSGMLIKIDRMPSVTIEEMNLSINTIIEPLSEEVTTLKTAVENLKTIINTLTKNAKDLATISNTSIINSTYDQERVAVSTEGAITGTNIVPNETNYRMTIEPRRGYSVIPEDVSTTIDTAVVNIENNTVSVEIPSVASSGAINIDAKKLYTVEVQSSGATIENLETEYREGSLILFNITPETGFSINNLKIKNSLNELVLYQLIENTIKLDTPIEDNLEIRYDVVLLNNTYNFTSELLNCSWKTPTLSSYTFKDSFSNIIIPNQDYSLDLDNVEIPEGFTKAVVDEGVAINGTILTDTRICANASKSSYQIFVLFTNCKFNNNGTATTISVPNGNSFTDTLIPNTGYEILDTNVKIFDSTGRQLSGWYNSYYKTINISKVTLNLTILVIATKIDNITLLKDSDGLSAGSGVYRKPAIYVGEGQDWLETSNSFRNMDYWNNISPAYITKYNYNAEEIAAKFTVTGIPNKVFGLGWEWIENNLVITVPNHTTYSISLGGSTATIIVYPIVVNKSNQNYSYGTASITYKNKTVTADIILQPAVAFLDVTSANQSGLIATKVAADNDSNRLDGSTIANFEFSEYNTEYEVTLKLYGLKKWSLENSASNYDSETKQWHSEVRLWRHDLGDGWKVSPHYTNYWEFPGEINTQWNNNIIISNLRTNLITLTTATELIHEHINPVPNFYYTNPGYAEVDKYFRGKSDDPETYTEIKFKFKVVEGEGTIILRRATTDIPHSKQDSECTKYNDIFIINLIKHE